MTQVKAVTMMSQLSKPICEGNKTQSVVQHFSAFVFGMDAKHRADWSNDECMSRKLWRIFLWKSVFWGCRWVSENYTHSGQSLVGQQGY